MLPRRDIARAPRLVERLPGEPARTKKEGKTRPGSRAADLLWILLVWVATALVSFYLEPQYDEFSNTELVYYTIYNVGIGAFIGFWLFDRLDRLGALRFATGAAGLILAGTLINESLVEPFVFETGPINFEGVYYGLADALMSVGVFLLLRLARQLASLRQRIVDAANARRLAADTGCFFVRVTGETRRICAADVIYMQAEKDFTRIVCSEGEHFASESLKTLVEKSAPLDIVRIHKSFAVNLNKVERLTRSEAWIGAFRVPVGRRYWEEFADSWKRQSAYPSAQLTR